MEKKENFGGNNLKKVSVITTYYIQNYGSVLQAYATAKEFEKFGYSTEFVQFVRDNERGKVKINERRTGNALKKAIYLLYKKYDSNKKKSVFKKFVDDKLEFSQLYSNKEELFANPPVADVYCVGSDQMWNSDYNGGVLPEVFLEYAPETAKKITYSVSMGKEEFSEEELNEMASYVKKFSMISVRESNAIGILEKMGYTDGVHVLDPTFMLTKDEWKKAMTKNKVKGKYVLVYQLNKNSEMDEFAEKLAKEKNIKVVKIAYYLSQKIGKPNNVYCPSVSEFLSLFNDAEYVVTDSFHGTAFSLNFNKQLYAFNPPRFSSRIKSILQLLGLENRLVENIADVDYNEVIEYDPVNEILNGERRKMEELLSSTLNENTES